MLLLLAILQASSATPPSASMFQPRETIEASSAAGYQTHKGTFEGLSYEYMTDGAGDVVNGVVDGPAIGPGYASSDPDRWVITAKRDKMTDRTSWYLNHYQTGLMLGLDSRGEIVAACLIGADFPGRSIAIRVGNNPAIRLEERCAPPPARLQAELEAGGRLITRGYEWPNDFPKDKEGLANGFGAALKLYAFLWARSQ